MKKLGAFFVLSAIVILLALIFIPLASFVHAQELGESGLPSDIEKIQNITDSASQKVSGQNASYLAAEWKTMLLKNKYWAAFDSFMQKISIVFQILMGEPYNLSPNFLVVFCLWIIFIVYFIRIIRDFSMFSRGISYVIAFALVTIMGQTKVFTKMADYLINIYVSPDQRITRLIIFMVVFLLLMTTIVFARINKAKKKKRQQEEAEEKMKTITKYGEKLEKAAEKNA